MYAGSNCPWEGAGMMIAFERGRRLRRVPEFDIQNWRMVAVRPDSFSLRPGGYTLFNRCLLMLFAVGVAGLIWFSAVREQGVAMSARLGLDVETAGFALAALLGLMGTMAPLSCLWTHLVIERNARNDLVVRGWGIVLPFRKAWPLSAFRQINIHADEMYYRHRHGRHHEGWRFSASLLPAPPIDGVRPPVGAEYLSSFGVVFHIFRQRERPFGRLPAPVEEFIRNLQKVTGLRCGTPTVHERSPSGRSHIEQATTLDGQRLEGPVYRSREEMPEDVRASFDRMARDGRMDGTYVRHEHIQTSKDHGSVRTYDSLDEVPPEIRSQIEAARKGAMAPGTHRFVSQTITIRDAAGTVHTYHSPDEMPPDVRARYEEVRRRLGQ